MVVHIVVFARHAAPVDRPVGAGVFGQHLVGGIQQQPERKRIAALATGQRIVGCACRDRIVDPAGAAIGLRGIGFTAIRIGVNGIVAAAGVDVLRPHAQLDHVALAVKQPLVERAPGVGHDMLRVAPFIGIAKGGVGMLKLIDAVKNAGVYGYVILGHLVAIDLNLAQRIFVMRAIGGVGPASTAIALLADHGDQRIGAVFILAIGDAGDLNGVPDDGDGIPFVLVEISDDIQAEAFDPMVMHVVVFTRDSAPVHAPGFGRVFGDHLVRGVQKRPEFKAVAAAATGQDIHGLIGGNRVVDAAFVALGLGGIRFTRVAQRHDAVPARAAIHRLRPAAQRDPIIPLRSEDLSRHPTSLHAAPERVRRWLSGQKRLGRCVQNVAAAGRPRAEKVN